MLPVLQTISDLTPYGTSQPISILTPYGTSQPISILTPYGHQSANQYFNTIWAPVSQSVF